MSTTEGTTTTCRNCRETITWCTRTEPGFLPRTGWRDRSRIAALVCFKAEDFTHHPVEPAQSEGAGNHTYGLGG
jgi:hypothetical protein